MMNPNFGGQGMMTILLIIAIRDAIWKGIALWKAGNKKHLAWFVCIFLFNTVGILPIVYILFFNKEKKA